MSDTGGGGKAGPAPRWGAGFRGLWLPWLVAPLWFDVIIEIFRGRGLPLAGALLGIGLVWTAVARLRRAQAGDLRRAALLVAGGAGATAWLSAGLGPLGGAICGLGGYVAMRLLYDGAVAEAPAPPEPLPEPEPEAQDPLIVDAAARLARVRERAARLREPRLARVADAMAGVLEDLRARPERLPMARRFLVVQLDGVDRIAERLEAGAEPPPSLGPLLGELERAAATLRTNLRAEENAALEVQVKVLADRLREEGYR